MGRLGLFLAVPLLVIGGFWYYNVETAEIIADRYEFVSAIGRLKSTQVADWRSRLLRDVAAVARANVTREGFADALVAPSDHALGDLLAFFQANHDYDATFAVSLEGRVLAAAGEDTPFDDPATRQAVAEVVRTRAPAMSLLHRGAGHIEIDAVAPLLDSAGSLAGVLVFRTNASATLDPLVQSWPTPNRTAETLLVMSDGDDVLFLNELRHRSGTALSFRQPRAKDSLPAAQAVSGRSGEFRGVDYRGVAVLADLRQVPESPWFLVTKVDMDEILADAQGRALSISFVVALLIGLLLTAAAYLLRQAQASALSDLYAAERRARETEERFRTTLYSIGDAVVSTDMTGAIREMNRVAERLTGWSEAEVRGRPLHEVFRIVNERTRETVESPVAAVLRDGKVVALANHTVLVARDGSEVPIADSAAPIQDGAGTVSGVVLVFSDQTMAYAARLQIEESEERLRLALRAANQGTYDVNVQTGEARVSPEFASMLGYDPATFHETLPAWVERLHPDDRAGAEGELLAYLDGRRPDYHAEFRQRTADGGWKWIMSQGRVVSWSPDGKPLRLLGTHTDISAQKASEARIKRLSQLYATLSECNQAIVRSSGEADLFPQLCRDAVLYGDMKMAWIGMADPATGRVRPVASYGDDLGYLDDIEICVDGGSPHGTGPTGTAIRENRPVWFQDFLGDPRAAAWHDRAAAMGWASSASLPLRRDGAAVGAITLYSGVPAFFEGEVQQLLIEMAADVSFAIDSFAREALRKDAEARAEASRHQLEATLNAVPDLMFEVDLEGRIHACHTPREDLLLAPPNVFLGRTVAEVMPAPASQVIIDAIAEAGRRGRAVGATYELDLPGGTSWFELSVAQKATPPGEPERLLALARDVTARTLAERQRDRLEAQLRQVQKMEAIGQLAGGVAHDFNNLLTIINGRADLVLARMDETHAFHDDLADIRQAGERAAGLTRQLLTFSRQQVVAPVVVELRSVIVGMQSMLRRLVSEDIRLLVSVAPDVGAVKADPGQLEQVILNLVINACDAMPDGGELSIDARSIWLDADAAASIAPALPAAHYAVISVRDNGTGMDEATSARAFEPFFTTKGLGKGTGLGLSTAYGIVTQCKGAVTLASTPQVGTTFDVYLPCIDTAGVPRRPVGPVALPSGHETILVVDDEPALVTIASRILSMAGYTVLTAKDGLEALEVLASHGSVDLLLTDVVIPGMNGRVLAERVLELYPLTKVLFSSGYTDDVVLRRGVESSCAHFIGKPYSVGDLTSKVREVLSASAG